MEPATPPDLWAHRSTTLRCATCIWYAPKGPKLGRCRRHAPVADLGYPPVFPADWCGDHKLDEARLPDATAGLFDPGYRVEPKE